MATERRCYKEKVAGRAGVDGWDSRPYQRLAMAKWRTRRISKHVFFRNEPTVFSDEFLCITSIVSYLCRLQRWFAGGFVLENEPTGRVFLGGERQEVSSFPSKSGFVLRIDDNRKGGSRL